MKLITALTLALGLLVVPQTAAAATCAWRVSELPAPAGYSHATATGHAGTGLVVGTVWKTDHREGVVWRSGVPQVLPQPPGRGAGSNYPLAVNPNGVIAGRWQGSDGAHFAWRYQNGAYQALPNRGTWVSVPTDINRAGDVVGFSRLFFGGAQVNALLWPVATPGSYVDFGEAAPRGVDDSRRVVLSTGRVVNADGTSWQLQGGLPSAYEDGRLVGYRGTASPYTIVEWNLSGQVLRTIPDGVPTGVNASGVIVGVHTNGGPRCGATAAWST
ncbi:hypothetical protein ACFQV2_31260 [Actinokineospora soli]|uniref:Extracellular repeat, HAF family n=1 Tax=Actinokineospora soli TaxID=1048753 RepID=A0ABW2TXQ3_9PSEU